MFFKAFIAGCLSVTALGAIENSYQYGAIGILLGTDSAVSSFDEGSYLYHGGVEEGDQHVQDEFITDDADLITQTWRV